VGLFQAQDEFLAAAPKLDADLIVLEYATIQPDHIREIGTLMMGSGARRAIVVYRVAARATLERLESPRVVPIRGPIDRAELQRWCLPLHARFETPTTLSSDYAFDLTGAPPARRFDEATLAKIAAASVSVRCECPHHLVDLISNLGAFELYSEECQVLHVEDAALHALLHSATAQARALLETALARLIEVDEIEV
jgi:hypothetical protein